MASSSSSHSKPLSEAEGLVSRPKALRHRLEVVSRLLEGRRRVVDSVPRSQAALDRQAPPPHLAVARLSEQSRPRHLLAGLGSLARLLPAHLDQHRLRVGLERQQRLDSGSNHRLVRPLAGLEADSGQRRRRRRLAVAQAHLVSLKHSQHSERPRRPRLGLAVEGVPLEAVHPGVHSVSQPVACRLVAGRLVLHGERRVKWIKVAVGQVVPCISTQSRVCRSM